MNFIEVENRHYILATSSLADQRTMVLKQGDTFAIFDYHGDIHKVGAGKQGIYHNGTRHMALMELKINGKNPMLLSSSPGDDNQVLMIDLTNPDLHVENGEIILRETIHIKRTKFIWLSVYHEKIEIENFRMEPVSFEIEAEFDADFSDIFEVRGSVREKKGFRQEPQPAEEQIVFGYVGLDEVKRTTKVSCYPTPASIRRGTALYEIDLPPRGKTELEIKIEFNQGEIGEEILSMNFDSARDAMKRFIKHEKYFSTDILTSNASFNDWIIRSRSDMLTMVSQTRYGLYPYAGVPWYCTPFGRDGIITAMECLWIEPEIARGVLHYLAATQALEFNDFQDAEPGKIFHETRGGEMAALDEIPYKLYYGTIDATPLFICLAGAYLERTNDIATIRKIWTNIERALHWIDVYGDVDGDGFVEYKTKSSKGLTNQGWKDSQDSIFYEDGGLAEDPIALCEVQGYVYDAKIKACLMARELGHKEIASKLEDEAISLKGNFNRMFWSETKHTYVLALDGKKNQCNVVSSNAGHCLFSGIATPERAAIVARHLLDENMFSGWGIRTISTQEQRYNPMSYHNGSIWPHDNAMIAFGFSRYQLMNDAIRVVTGAFDTAGFVENNRLPELFCGFPRENGKAPISYPVACSPQAWAVGAVFLMIQACLGLKIDAKKKVIELCMPVLPRFLHDITITNLKVDDKPVVFQVRRIKDGVDAVMLTPNSGVEIKVYNKPEIERMPVLSH